MDILAPDGTILFQGTNEKGESLYDDASVREKNLMGINTLTLKFSTVDYIDFPEGSYAFFSRDNTGTGEYYYLLDTSKSKMNHTRHYEYDIILESQQTLLQTRIFKFFTVRDDGQTTPTIDSIYKTKSWYTGRPKDFLQLIVMSMNDGDAGWEIGSYLEGDSKTIEFNNMNCMEFLQQVANTYNTEWEVVGKTINLGKVEKDKSNPIVLSYGKGYGFVGGITKDKGKTRRINRLLIQGGSRNIYFSQYNNDTLLFPKNRTVTHEGVDYKTDQYGKYLQRVDFDSSDRIVEDVLDLSEIYPMREGEITATVTNSAGGIYTITDSTLVSEGLDYTNYFIEGVTPTLVLHSGDMPGREFNIELYDNSTGTFTIKAHSDGGVMLPNDSLRPRVGNRYAIFNVMLPPSYIAAAEDRALSESVPYLHEESKRKFTVNGEVQGLYAKNNWASIGGKLDVGYFVQFDNIMLPEPENVRITKILDKVNYPMKPQLELSNEVKVNSWSNMKNDINRQEVITDNKVNSSTNYGMRNWWDVKQTQDMMFDPDGQFQQDFSSALKAEFGHLVVGLNSAQMDFKGVIFQPNYNNNPNNFRSTAGTLDHFTINGNDTVRTWNVGASNWSLNASNAYYVYVKCLIESPNAEIYVTTEKITITQVPFYYHFFVGTLNTPRTDSGVTTRSWKPVFGFTEISGSDIVTGVLRDRLSRLVIDLVNGTITGKVTFTSGSSGYNNLTDKPDIDSITNTANNALNLAGNKKRVFRSTPYTPYEAGDLWVNSTKNGGNDIMVCSTTRLTGSYSANDWGLATNYDNTKVVIDNGVVTAGAVRVTGEAGTEVAGIAGYGQSPNSIRIWAGTYMSNNANANFRVDHNGRVYSKNGFIIEDANKYENGGFSSEGSGTTPVRLWIGNDYNGRESAKFRVTAGGNVHGQSFTMGNGAGLWDTALHLPNDGIILLSDLNDKRSIALRAQSVLTLTAPVVSITDTENSGVDVLHPSLISANIGRSVSSRNARVWLDCSTAGWGSKFRVESRYFNDANSMERTVINCGRVMIKGQLQNSYSSLGASGSISGLPLYWDSNSGYIYANN